MTFKDVSEWHAVFRNNLPYKFTRTANISFNYTKLRGQKNNKEKFSYSVKMNSNGLMEIDPFVLDTQSGKEYSCWNSRRHQNNVLNMNDEYYVSKGWFCMIYIC